MLANAASTEPPSSGSVFTSPSSSSTFATPSSPRFFSATASMAGELSTATTRATLGAIPAATKPVPVPTSTTVMLASAPETSAILSMTRPS